ncbi:MAG TPA: glycosyltransferase [Pyrinomonadaceae bacterium]
MKVLHFLDSLDRGGAEAQALDVCRNASRFGLEMTLVTAKGGALEEEFRATDVEYIRLGRKLPIDPGLASQLRRIIIEREIEIVHGYQAVDGLHLLLATRGLKNVRRVLSFQGFIQDRKNRLTSKFLVSRMDANIAVSRGMLKWLTDVDRLDTSRNFHVIYNGADPARIEPTGHSLRGELQLPANTPLIGMVGNFYRDPRKDQLTVCRALPSVFAQFENVRCVFAGGVEPGAEEKLAACERFCAEHGLTDRVHFLGGRSDVPDILAALNVFVFSSLHEGLPLAVSEAMLAGVAMIVSDIEPLLEASGNGQYAEVFPVGDEKALAEKLRFLLSDPTRREDLASKAKAFALDNFSIDGHMRELVKLYRSLTD